MRVTRHRSFDDPALASAWADALTRRPHDVFTTLGWQRAWWNAYGRGELILLEAEGREAGRTLMPLFLDSGMLFLVGSGGSDRLDLVGDCTADSVAALVRAALDAAPCALGMRLYHVPAESPSAGALVAAAARVGLDLVEEDVIHDPVLDIRSDGATALAKQSLVRHERAMRRDGELTLHDIRDAEAALPWLDAFFDQHARRWGATGRTSPFAIDPRERAFYREVALEGGAEGWLRFLVLEWQGQPAAFHFGTRYGDTYLYYKPSFEISLAHRSPGEVMFRALIGAARAEGAEWLDLGIGDEPYKTRFTSVIRTVRTVGLYPPAITGRAA